MLMTMSLWFSTLRNHDCHLVGHLISLHWGIFG
jgi:hypothetical protein